MKREHKQALVNGYKERIKTHTEHWKNSLMVIYAVNQLDSHYWVAKGKYRYNL